jgi:hypothetical protein
METSSLANPGTDAGSVILLNTAFISDSNSSQTRLIAVDIRFPRRCLNNGCPIRQS